MSNPLLMTCASLALAATAACGQKGPLYLPDENGSVITRPGAQTEEESATKDEEEDQDAKTVVD